MSKRPQAAACACGQVLFETAERKAGDELSCPWCERKYRYLGEDRIEPWSPNGKPPAKDSADEDDEEEGEGEEHSADKPAEQAAGEEPPKKKKKKKKKKKPPSERLEAARDEKDSGRQKTQKEIREPEKGGVGAAVVRIPPAADLLEKKKPPGDGESKRANVSVRTKRPKEIPGGIFPMIGFIIGFNALALLLLQYAVVKIPDGGGAREAFWGATVPKSAIWPELAALLIGHIVGFFAWSWYVYELQKLNANTEKAQQ
jgi:hypothetical protein